jgi:hypothetical protein
MHRDAAEPRSQAFRMLETIHRIDRRYENVLSQIAQIDIRPEQANEHALHVFVMAIVERRSASGLPRTNRRHDGRV